MIALSIAAIFAALFILVLLALPRWRVSKQRLGIETERRSLGQSVEGVLGSERSRRLARDLALADVNIEPGRFVLWVLVASILAAILGLLVSPVLAVAGLVAPYLIARAWVSYKGSKRQAKFAEQLPEFLQSLVMSLRSGFGFSQAIETTLVEADEPIKGEIERVMAEVRMGRDLSDALRSLSVRMDNQDLEWVVGAVDINRETGGNLSEILATVNATIRERARIGRKIKTFTAEGRLSARILTILPFVMALWQWRVHPDGFAVLFSGTGLVVLLGCLGLMVVGWFWIRRIVTIKL